jgi:hypothetical protein
MFAGAGRRPVALDRTAARRRATRRAVLRVRMHHRRRPAHPRRRNARRHRKDSRRDRISARFRLDTTAPTVPNNLTGTAGNGSAALAWDPASDRHLVGYHVYRDGVRVASLGLVTSYVESAMINGVGATFRVDAYDRAGNVSAASNAVTVVPGTWQPATTAASVASLPTPTPTPTPTVDGSPPSAPATGGGLAAPACTTTASPMGAAQFQSVLDSLAGGAVLCLHAGTYGARGTRVNVTRSGTAGATITIRGIAGEARPALLGFYVITASHTRFDSVHFDGPTGNVGNPDTPSGEDVEVWLKGGAATEISHSEIEGSRWHAGIFVSDTSAMRIASNWIHDNGDPADPIQSNSSHGIYMATGSGTITSNLVEHNVAYGIHLYNGAGSSAFPHDVLISENTSVDNGRAGIILSEGTRSSRVVDNITAYNGTVGIYGWSLTNSTNVASNNIEFGNAQGSVLNYLGTGSLQFSGDVVADPQFVASVQGATGGDYRVRSGSPAANRGLDAYRNVDDMNGMVRPLGGAPDIGAFESH